MDYMNNNDEIQVENMGYDAFPEVNDNHDYNNPESVSMNPGFGFETNLQNQSDPFQSYQIVTYINPG
jgi:hypothetical protein